MPPDFQNSNLVLAWTSQLKTRNSVFSLNLRSVCRNDAEEAQGVQVRKFVQLDIPGMELVKMNDSKYADGYEWQALVTDFDLPAADILPLYRERGDCENLWNIFARLGEDGSRPEAATSRPLLQSCSARVSRHARQGVLLSTAFFRLNRHRKIYRAHSTRRRFRRRIQRLERCLVAPDSSRGGTRRIAWWH